jgi:hypothetical protein
MSRTSDARRQSNYPQSVFRSFDNEFERHARALLARSERRRPAGAVRSQKVPSYMLSEVAYIREFGY